MPGKLRKSRSRNVTKSNNRPASKQSRNRKTPKGKGKTKGKGKRTRRRVKRGGAEQLSPSYKEILTSNKSTTDDDITNAMKKYFGIEQESDKELKEKLIDFLIKLPLLIIKYNRLTLTPHMSKSKQATSMCSKRIEKLTGLIMTHLDEKYKPELSVKKFDLLIGYVEDYLTRKHGITCTQKTNSDINLIGEVESKLDESFKGIQNEKFAEEYKKLIKKIDSSYFNN